MIFNTNSVSVSFNGSNSYDPDGGALTYVWRFGDGSTGSGATPSHTYTSPGIYEVTLTVTDDENKTDSDSITVTVKALPVADAGDDQMVELDSTTNSVRVDFDGSKSHDPDDGTNPGDGIVSYGWSFGDGSTGSGATPSHTYTALGTYTAILTVTDNDEVDASDSLTVTVQPDPGVLTAEAGPNQTTCVGSTVNFDGSGSYAPVGRTIESYSWSFGSDATPASGTGVTPSCVYSTHGEKTVTLTVRDSGGDTDSDTMTVTVTAPPVADAGDDQTVDISTIVYFDGSASRAHAGRTIASYSWDFGSDAAPATITGVSPFCTYSAHGEKTVTLTVTDSGGDTDSDTMTVTVNAPPVADAGGDKEVYLNSNTNSVTVSFDGSNSYDPDGGPLTYAWSFGDGSTGSGATPSHTYTSSGTYTVTLTVMDDEQVEDSDSLIVTVQPDPGVLTSGPGPERTVDVGTIVTFDGSGSYAPVGRTITSYSWNFGSDATPATGTGDKPSCTYSAHGEKTVTLTVTDSGGDTDSSTMIVIVKAPPVADAGDDQTVELDSNTNSVDVNFDGSNSNDPDGGTLTYTWDFGDGWIGSGATLSHTYTSAGTYTVTLTVTDDENKTDSDTMTVTVQSLPPVADAGDDQTVELDPITNSVSVNFDGSNSYDPDGGALTYAWNFGDGSTGSGATPSHTYTSIGTYTVTLTVTDDENEPDSDTVTVTVQTPPPVADAGNNQTVALDSNTNSVSVSFNGSNSYDPDGGTLTYAWNFGDGSTGSGAMPSHTYTSMGTYTVMFDGSGSYAPAGRTIDAYAWDFGDESTGSGVRSTHTYNTPGTYTVELAVTDDQAAPHKVTATDSLTLTVFRLEVDSDNTHSSLVFTDDSASGTNSGSGSDGASGASGTGDGGGTRSESGTTTGSTTSTSSAQFTFTLKPGDATITTSVHIDVYSSNTNATWVKRIYDVTGPGRTFAASWDGTDSEGYRVPDGNYQVKGTVTYLASDDTSYSSVAAHTVAVSGGSVSVKILNTDVRSNDPESANLYSDTTADVDTVGHGTSGSRSDSATIHYEITGGGVDKVLWRRVLLHIYKVVIIDEKEKKIEVKTISLGSAVGTRLTAYWGGTDDSDQFSYGEHFAKITIDLDFNSANEPEEDQWQQSHGSNSHAITVYSFPVANAGGNQIVRIAPETDSETVNFDASGSHDPDGIGTGQEITKYSWEFPGGNPESFESEVGKPGFKPTTFTEYSTLGEKTVTLEVTDNDDPAETSATKVTVTVLKLSLDKTPETITRGDDVTFTAIIEPSALNLNPTFDWKFHYTDAGVPGGVSEYTGTTNSWSGKMVKSGTLEVKAKINDATFIETLTVNVEERAWETEIFYKEDRTTWGTERPAKKDHGLGQTETRWARPEYEPEDKLVDPEIDDVKSGPNKGFWYVTKVTLCSVLTISINKHFKMAEKNLPLPKSWIDFRNAQGTSGTDEVQYAEILPAVETHEGTHLNKRINSHYQFWYVDSLKKGTRDDPARRVERITTRFSPYFKKEGLSTRFNNHIVQSIGLFIKQVNERWNTEKKISDRRGYENVPDYLPAGKEIDWDYPD